MLVVPSRDVVTRASSASAFSSQLQLAPYLFCDRQGLDPRDLGIEVALGVCGRRCRGGIQKCSDLIARVYDELCGGVVLLLRLKPDCEADRTRHDWYERDHPPTTTQDLAEVRQPLAHHDPSGALPLIVRSIHAIPHYCVDSGSAPHVGVGHRDGLDGRLCPIGVGLLHVTETAWPWWRREVDHARDITQRSQSSRKEV